MSQSPPTMMYTNLPTPRRAGKSLFGWALFIFLAVMLFMLTQSHDRNTPVISLSEFDQLLHAGSIQTMTIDSYEVSGVLKSGVTIASGKNSGTFRALIPAGGSGNWSFVHYVLTNRGDAEVRMDENQNVRDIAVPLIPWILIFFFIWFFVFRHLKKAAQVQRT